MMISADAWLMKQARLDAGLMQAVDDGDVMMDHVILLRDMM